MHSMSTLILALALLPIVTALECQYELSGRGIDQKRIIGDQWTKEINFSKIFTMRLFVNFSIIIISSFSFSKHS